MKKRQKAPSTCSQARRPPSICESSIIADVSTPPLFGEAEDDDELSLLCNAPELSCVVVMTAMYKEITSDCARTDREAEVSQPWIN